MREELQAPMDKLSATGYQTRELHRGGGGDDHPIA